MATAMLALPEGVELIPDPSVATWVVERLRPWGTERVRVASFVPEGYEAYTRILHPLYWQREEEGIRWSTIAERRGRTVGRETGFREISGLEPGTPEWDHAVPSDGSLPRSQLRALMPLLDEATATPDRCWFCIWDGYGIWWADAHSPLYPPNADPGGVAAFRRRAEEQDEFLRRMPRVRAEKRAYFLFRGPLFAAGSFELRGWYQSPNLWWPDDRTWCVATEIDGYSTYLGGSRGCVDRLIASPELEAIEVWPDTRLDPGPYLA